MSQVLTIGSTLVVLVGIMVVLVGSLVCPGGGTNCSAIGTDANARATALTTFWERRCRDSRPLRRIGVAGARPG